ncbi:MAG: type II and III secretion system protein, partial [Kiritimatiellae bacterium]|nr:type II and III secretion system protein [Kiritimatiellia bacterium]
VVREIIYPTEFDAQSQSVGTGAGESSDRTVVVVTPGSFETREVGVILNVTPTVGPDGYTIDLAMVPEVSELIGWIEYGSAMGEITYHMPQPIFSSRNVTTSIVIWDGQTVVMGGMIREELTTVNDKIPLLGDIPLLGRLFRTEGEYSQKKNLLIFVTARLVDPAGKPIHKRENVGGMPGSVTGASDAVTEQI